MARIKRIKKKEQTKNLTKTVSYELQAQIRRPEPLSGVFFLKLIHKSKFEW